MKIIKSKQKRMVDVYTVDGVEFLNEEDAIKFHNENLTKSNQELFEVFYDPKLEGKMIVYNKKVFISITKLSNKKGATDVALIVALNQISKKHKDILSPQTFKKRFNDNPVTVDGFKIEKVKFNNSIEYDEITQKAYPIHGKPASVKLYKANEFGQIIKK